MPFLRKFTRFFLALATLFCVFYLGAWALIRTDRLRSWIETSAHDAGIELRLEKMVLEFPFNLILSAPEATIPDRFSFSSKEIRANVNPLSLIFGRLASLELHEPRILVHLTPSESGGTAPSVNLLVRSFVVENGRVEIRTDEGPSITIPRIDLSGHDLNLGSRSGEMETVASVPELNGELKIRISANPAAITSNLELLQQRNPGSGGPPDPQTPGKGRAEITLHFEPDSSLRLTGRASLDGIAFDPIRYTGSLEFLARTDAARETVTLELESDTTDIAGLGLKDSSRAFPLATKVAGQYAASNSQLTLSAIHAVSQLGSVAGRAGLSFDKEPRLTSAALEMSGIDLSRLQHVIPDSVVQLLGDLRGEVSTTLTLTGELAPWAVSGTLETTATGIAGTATHIGRLKGTIPFAVRAGRFEATRARLDAQKLDWRLPGQALSVGIPSLAITGDLSHATGEAGRFSGALEIRDGRFATEDGLSAAENIGASASLELVARTDGTTHAQLELRLNAMELLWNRFFGDFKPERPFVNLSGTYDSKARTLRIASGRVSLERIGGVSFSGDVRNITAGPAFEIRVESPQLRVKNLYDFFVRETLKTSYPILGRLQLAGTVGAEAILRGVAEKFSIAGTVQARNTAITSSDHWGVGPIDVTLPFDLQYPERLEPAAGSPAPPAALAVRKVNLGNTEIPPFTVFLSLWENALTLLKPLHVPVYGGAFIIERLGWHDILGAPRKFSFSARIDDISLADLTEQQGWQRFNGSLTGVIPQITWAEDAFRTDGELELRAFDGEIKLDHLEVTRLGASLPAVKANVEIRGIDLEKATRAFEFGNISGILAGTVEELVISEGQPSQFRAKVETVERSGVSQWISVEALNKITVLSSGAEGNALYGTLAGLFSSYRYRKLGFKAQLRNDLLILQGIKTEGGKEFLVEGSLIPPTVNIVSHTQRIGFKELLRRLERIRQTEGGQGPTVQ